MRTQPWHSTEENVHHNHLQCRAARRVDRRTVHQGTGDKPLCPECAMLGT